MADGRSFAETIVGLLGTPRETFGPEEWAALGLLAAAGAAWIALEQGLAAFVARPFRASGSGDDGDAPPADRDPPSP